MRWPPRFSSGISWSAVRGQPRHSHVLAAAAILLGLFSCSRTLLDPNRNSWRLFPGHVEPVSFPAFRDGRKCWVYLPPGYANSTQRYPVLYLSDGDLAFDGPGGMHVNRVCEDLIRRREMRPIIVVAIGRISEIERLWDLSPWPDSYYSRTGGGDLFVRAIRDTLKPSIDRRYRTLPESRHTAIGGVSLGGLLATYTGYAYDSTFGNIAAFSPSYWWGDSVNIHDFVRAKGRPRHLLRFYQDTGRPFDNSIDEMSVIAVEQGFHPNWDFLSLSVDGARHITGAWEHRFPTMLRFLFPPEPG